MRREEGRDERMPQARAEDQEARRPVLVPGEVGAGERISLTYPSNLWYKVYSDISLREIAMGTKTTDEVAVMVKHLEESKKTLPEFSVFGDNNWLGIDKMVEVLQGRYPTQDDIYRDEDTRPREITSSMLLAMDWMDGAVDDEDIL